MCIYIFVVFGCEMFGGLLFIHLFFDICEKVKRSE